MPDKDILNRILSALVLLVLGLIFASIVIYDEVNTLKQQIATLEEHVTTLEKRPFLTSIELSYIDQAAFHPPIRVVDCGCAARKKK